MKFGNEINKIILSALEANIDRLPEPDHEIQVFKDIEQELLNKNFKVPGTNWKSLRTYFKQSLVYQVFRRTYRLPEPVYEKLIYPHLIKLFRIDVKYFRGVTTYTQQQLINLRNVMLYDLKPGRFSAEIYASFMCVKGQTVKINVDDPGFVTVIQEDLKKFLVKKTEHEKERKVRARNKRKKPDEPKPTDWISGNGAEMAGVSVQEGEDYIIEDDEEPKELNEQEMIAQELENVNVENWLTLLSQEFLSPSNQSAVDTQANETTYVNTTSTQNLLNLLDSQSEIGAVNSEPTIVSGEQVMQMIIDMDIGVSREELELYYCSTNEYQIPVEGTNLGFNNQRTTEVRLGNSVETDTASGLLQKLIAIGVRVIPEEFELYYSGFPEYKDAVDAINRLKSPLPNNLEPTICTTATESVMDRQPIASKLNSPKKNTLSAFANEPTAGHTDIQIPPDNQLIDQHIPSESFAGEETVGGQQLGLPCSNDIRINPLEFVEAQPPKQHEEIVVWLGNTENVQFLMQEELVDDPLRSFTEEAEDGELTESCLTIANDLDEQQNTRDPVLTCHVIGDDTSGDEECEALSQRAFKKKVNIPRRQILRLKKRPN